MVIHAEEVNNSRHPEQPNPVVFNALHVPSRQLHSSPLDYRIAAWTVDCIKTAELRGSWNPRICAKKICVTFPQNGRNDNNVCVWASIESSGKAHVIARFLLRKSHDFPGILANTAVKRAKETKACCLCASCIIVAVVHRYISSYTHLHTP